MAFDEANFLNRLGTEYGDVDVPGFPYSDAGQLRWFDGGTGAQALIDLALFDPPRRGLGEAISPFDFVAGAGAGKLAGFAKPAHTGTPVPRNPYGSKGKLDHQAKVSELERKAFAERLPGEQVWRERKVQGLDSSRRPDVQIVDPTGKTRKIFEAERFPNRQYNRLREAEYDRLGVPFETHPL